MKKRRETRWEDSAPVLSIRNLTRTFHAPRMSSHSVDALCGVSLDLYPASFTAIVGASGSGKSTLMMCAAGLDQVTAGEVHILGTEISGLDASQRADLRADHIGFIFQDDNLVTALNVADNVALPARLRRGRLLSKFEVYSALERVGLSGQAHQMPSELSGGERQRVAVARVLANRPRLIFADEPTAALDLISGNKVIDWLREATQDAATVLMVTRDAQVASRADEVLVMEAGHISGRMNGGDAAAVASVVLAGTAGRSAQVQCKYVGAPL